VGHLEGIQKTIPYAWAPDADLSVFSAACFLCSATGCAGNLEGIHNSMHGIIGGNTGDMA
jgi:hypothetical protein